MSEHQSWCMIWAAEPCTCQPQEMASLTQIKEALERLEAGQMNILAAQDKIWQLVGAVHTHLADLHVKLDNHDAWARDFDGVEEAKFNARANAWENVLRELNTKLDAGLRGVSDGCGLAIAELRKELLGTPQRGRKHSCRRSK